MGAAAVRTFGLTGKPRCSSIILLAPKREMEPKAGALGLPRRNWAYSTFSVTLRRRMPGPCKRARACRDRLQRFPSARRVRTDG